MNEIKKCPHCDQNMMIYRRNIRPNMLFCLHKLFFVRHNKPSKTVKIDIRSNVISDFPKLRFWGLVDVDNGFWKVTPRGVQFLLGEIAIPKYKWVYNNTVVDDVEDNPYIRIYDIKPELINKEMVLEWATGYTAPGVEKNSQIELAF